MQGDGANLTDDASYREEIQALANKLQYTGNDKKLSTTVQINEGVTTSLVLLQSLGQIILILTVILL